MRGARAPTRARRGGAPALHAAAAHARSARTRRDADVRARALRAAQPERSATVRFSLGLWVGAAATANTPQGGARAINEYKARQQGVAVPADEVPLVRRRPRAGSSPMTRPNSKTKYRASRSAARRRHGALQRAPRPPRAAGRVRRRAGLPRAAVVPVATVDKFAMMPWRGESGALFGRATLAGAPVLGTAPGRAHAHSKDGQAARAGSCRPSSSCRTSCTSSRGPLGTMVGLYETAIEYLSERTVSDGRGGAAEAPASTATVARAAEQISRSSAATTWRSSRRPASTTGETTSSPTCVDRPANGSPLPRRRGDRAGHEGGAAARCTSTCWRRGAKVATGAARGQAADRLHDPGGLLQQPARARRHAPLVEDEVRARAPRIEKRPVPEGADAEPVVSPTRQIKGEPVELTSRESTSAIAANKARLAQPHLEDAARRRPPGVAT
jgi:hypothetical protein